MEILSSPIDLIKKSFSIFFEKNNFIYFLKIYVWLIPFQLFFLYQGYFVESQSKILNTGNVQDIVFKYPWFIASVILVNLIFLAVSFWVELAGIKAITVMVEGTGKTVKETFGFSWKMLWPFSLLLVLLGLIELGGFVLLIIPGIIFSVWYSFSKFIFVDQGLRIIDSLKESKKLVVGKFWPIFGRIIVFGVFVILLQIVFSILPFRIGSIISPFFGALFVLPYFLLYKELSG